MDVVEILYVRHDPSHLGGSREFCNDDSDGLRSTLVKIEGVCDLTVWITGTLGCFAPHEIFIWYTCVWSTDGSGRFSDVVTGDSNGL